MTRKRQIALVVVVLLALTTAWAPKPPRECNNNAGCAHKRACDAPMICDVEIGRCVVNHLACETGR